MTATTDVTNHDRAAWANAALYLFRQLTGCDQEDALGDLLCDLMHWSGQHGFDFNAALDRARSHHENEVLEERLLPSEESAQAQLLLDITHLASKHDDRRCCPYTLLGLIEQKAIIALAQTISAGPEFLKTLDHVRATLRLRHLHEASDEEVDEALRMASDAIAKAKGDTQ